MKPEDKSELLRIGLLAVAVIAFSFLAYATNLIGTDPEGTVRALTACGYTDVEITGWRPFMASKGDKYATGFRAKSPTGDYVTGAVSSGWLKGHTIRLD